MSEIKVEISETTVRQVMENLSKQKTISPRDIGILLVAVNENSGLATAYSGVWGNGGFYCFGNDKGLTLSWKDFMNSKIKIGNIQI